MSAEETGARRRGARIERCVFERGWRELAGPSVLCVAAGELLVRGGEDIVRAVAQDLVLVAPGARCRVRAPRGPAHGERLDVDADFAQQTLDLCELAAGSDEEGAVVERRGTDRARRGARLLRELATVDSVGDGAARLRRLALCVELLALTLEPRLAPISPSGTGSRGHDRTARFLRSVEELRSIPLDEVALPSFARRAGLSERHVSRLFQLELGQTFREHLAGLRLERAKALLRGTEMSVIEVAGETGWSSLAHFNAVFRRRVGATPSRFRMGGESFPRSGRSREAGRDRVAGR